MIKGVFFDLGGTLFHYDHGNKEMGRHLINSFRALPGADRYAPADIGQAFAEANQEIARHYATLPYYLHADLFRDTYSLAVEKLELAFDEAAYSAYRSKQHHLVVDNLTLKEDCLPTLSELKAQGLYLSIVSNIDEDMLHPLVEREALHTVMDHWTSSEAAQSCKPHRDFFDISLAKSGLAAEEVLFVGDSPEHDINGAHAVGMRTVLIKNGDKPAPLQSGAATKEPHHTINQLSELIDLV